MRLFFQTFVRTGTAYATVKTFREQGLSFPRRPSCGPRAGELIWESLGIARAIAVLHNPRYAGAYTFGRGRWRKQPDGRTTRERLPREQWLVFLRDAHAGYLSWAEHEQITAPCAQCHAHAPSTARPPRGDRPLARAAAADARGPHDRSYHGGAKSSCTTTVTAAPAARRADLQSIDGAHR